MMIRLMWLMALLIACLAPASASALTVTLGPSSLPLSPGGPYSTARNSPVGSVIATATSTIQITGLSGSCSLNAVFLSGSPSSGNTYTTSVTGLGVNLYYINAGVRTQIIPGIQASLTLSPASPGPVTIEADLVVTGTVSSGTLNALPSVSLLFAGLGLGCSVLNLTTQTLTVTATPGTVTALTCTVLNPSLAITLPTISAQTLAASGKTGGATGFAIELNCNGTGAGIYITLTDANLTTNTSSLLSLAIGSSATNVKLQILKSSGAPVSYGPDSATAGTTNHWYVGPSMSVSSVPLTVQYVATGVATAGSVNAAATFTLSYQ